MRAGPWSGCSRWGVGGAAEGEAERLDADLVVIGSGVAGLTAALAAAPLATVVLTKAGRIESGSTRLAMGGIAAAVGPGDHPEAHARDTLAAACGLADPRAVAVLTREGPERVRWLLELGARFDREPDGRLALGREGAHGRARIVHAAGDATGAELARTLATAVRREARVRVVPRALAVEVLVSGSRAAGVAAVTRSGRRLFVTAPRVVLATGGCGHLWERTTAPREATGDGLALALALGLELVDPEMVQFHPTALAVRSDPLPLLTEAVRGAGAVLRDGAGRAFMREEHPLGDLAPRDVVARAVRSRLARGVPVFLDLTGLGRVVSTRFPAVVAAARAHGLDPRVQPLPVTPAAHYLMGGIPVDLEGRTALDGLWAVGEVAASGVHGANRLASNSLLEGLVFGWRAGRSAAEADVAPGAWPVRARWPAGSPWIAAAPLPVREAVAGLRRAMWAEAGVVRTRRGLERLLGRIEEIAALVGTRPSEAAAMVDVARAVALAALERDASLGAHYRADGSDGPALYHVAVRDGKVRRLPVPRGALREASERR